MGTRLGFYYLLVFITLKNYNSEKVSCFVHAINQLYADYYSHDIQTCGFIYPQYHNGFCIYFPGVHYIQEITYTGVGLGSLQIL